MPLQLIYTSAPRGVVAGRSGYCTVARSATLREAVMLQLEKWSHYQHLSLSGGQERPIHCCRIIDVRGTRYHVLSRIQDAGLDFTGRTNFVAHHLVFTPEEVREFPSPAVILRDWIGWAKSWSQEPEILDTEDWSSLRALHQIGLLPAARWQRLTGDSANGYGLLDCRNGIALRVDGVLGEEVLGLIGESLELLELRDPSHDFRATRWQYTFTTSLQDQDNTTDFRWRCFHSDNPASARFSGLDYRSLIEIRPVQITEVEALLARLGRQPPRFIEQPKKTHCFAAEAAHFKAVAEGVPPPTYQWFRVDRNNSGTEIPGAIESELLIPSAPLGVSRYVVRISNSAGDETSDVAELSCDRRPVAPAQHQMPRHERPVQVARDAVVHRGLAGGQGIEESHRIQPSVPTRTADEIARNRSRTESQVQDKKGTKDHLKWIVFIPIVLAAAAFFLKTWFESKRPFPELIIISGSNEDRVPQNGKEIKVKERVNIELNVDFTPHMNRNVFKYKWYHENEALMNSNYSLKIPNVREEDKGVYRVEISKDFNTNVLEAKLTIQKDAHPAPSEKPQPAASLDKLTDSLGTAKIGVDSGIEIEGWEHTKTEAASKGVIRQNGDAGNWTISKYKAAGHEKNEWVLMCKTNAIEKSITNVFYLEVKPKDLNESEIGVIFRKGESFIFFGLKGKSFVYCNETEIINNEPIKINPGDSDLRLAFDVVLMGDGNTIVVHRRPAVGLSGRSFNGPLDYSKYDWEIGYAFATGKSPEQAVAPSVCFKTSL